ncbi:NPCBM/NEW2 domain-containing protein [Streptomyces sp. NPDC018057]|uniref:NPCBM/NEW2 domain-containing protein n=1 Tax=unclassified Streptomyces TaxID=2593676 RepID=UPI0037999254
MSRPVVAVRQCLGRADRGLQSSSEAKSTVNNGGWDARSAFRSWCARGHRFFGLPAVVSSPTAVRVTVTETATVPGPTVTVTAPSADRSDPGSGSGPSASPSGSPGAERQSLTLFDPVDGSAALSAASGTLKGKKGKACADAVAVAFCTSGRFTEYNLGTDWKRFRATAGLDDGSSDWPMRVQTDADGRHLKNVRAGLGDPQGIDVDVTGVTRLRIGYEVLGDTCDYENQPRLVLGNPALSR